MSIVVRFPTSNMTRSQYDAVHDALERSGNWPATGCLFHICFGEDADLRVSEVWESRGTACRFRREIRPAHPSGRGTDVGRAGGLRRRQIRDI